MGGFAYAKSEGLGKGSSFYVCLPHKIEISVFQKEVIVGKILASEDKTSPFSSTENLFKQATQTQSDLYSTVLFAEVCLKTFCD